MKSPAAFKIETLRPCDLCGGSDKDCPLCAGTGRRVTREATVMPDEVGAYVQELGRALNAGTDHADAHAWARGDRKAAELTVGEDLVRISRITA